MHCTLVTYIMGLVVFKTATLNAEWNTKDFQKREHSLTKPYVGSGFSVPNWDFQDSTMVTSNYVRLTPDQRSKQGALWIVELEIGKCSLVLKLLEHLKIFLEMDLLFGTRKKEWK